MSITFEAVSYAPGASVLFQDLTLSVRQQGCTVIMGPAGGGKSTLLRLGAGLIPPDEGKVCFLGRSWHDVSDHDNADLREHLGFCFQNGALWANRSVYQNLELPYQYHRPKASTQEVREAVARTSRLVGVQNQLALRPSQLSLGEQKLVSLARALVLDPQVLFLDDPTGGLDAQATERLMGLFTDLKKQGRTLLLVTQDPTVTARVADALILVSAGKILVEGSFNEVVRSTNPEVTAILTSVLSQAATFSTDILDLLSIDQNGGQTLK